MINGLAISEDLFSFFNKSTLYNWKVEKIHRSSKWKVWFATIRGRPKAIDEAAETAIVAALQERTENKDPMPLSSANVLFKRAYYWDAENTI